MGNALVGLFFLFKNFVFLLNLKNTYEIVGDVTKPNPEENKKAIGGAGEGGQAFEPFLDLPSPRFFVTASETLSPSSTHQIWAGKECVPVACEVLGSLCPNLTLKLSNSLMCCADR